MYRMDLWTYRGKEERRIQSTTDIYTLPCVKQMPSGKLLYNMGSSAWYTVMTKRGWKEAQEGRNVCIFMVDSHC